MENINDQQLNKYQVTVHFDMDEDFMTFVPSHRVYINSLIDKGTIDYLHVTCNKERL